MEIPRATAERIRLVVLDVDGVMTDGGLYIGATGNGASAEFKRFDVQDGIGVKMLKQAGIHVAIVSGRVSEATELRAAELGVADVFQDDSARKVPILRLLLAAREVTWPEVALLGDDLADLPALRRVGLPATVANGTAEVRSVAAWRSSRPGGRGAVREFAEALLRARGEWDELVEEYCRERGE
ncbi:MAG: HAD-IIIA family hydrolase [Gemmatimonadota bacterium]|nr:HAD-IIIA family hydrolase [Gemmatimonadota bacterium]